MRFFSTTLILLVSIFPGATAQRTAAKVAPVQNVRLSLDQIVTNLEERNAERAAALQQFQGKRVYRMEYRGFPSDRDAEMVVKVSFHAPNSKDFTIESVTGSKFVIDHIFTRLLEGEHLLRSF